MPSTLDWQSYDKSNKLAKPQVESVANVITDPIKTALGDKEAKDRWGKRLSSGITEMFTSPQALTFVPVSVMKMTSALSKDLLAHKKALKGLKRGTKEFYDADKASFKKTGFTSNTPEGKTVYEVVDDISIPTFVDGKYKDVVGNKPLQKRIPSIKTDIVEYKNIGEDSIGEFESSRKTNKYKDTIRISNKDEFADFAETTIAHEGQHSVDKKGSMQLGADPGDALQELYANILGKIQRSITRLADKIDTLPNPSSDKINAIRERQIELTRKLPNWNEFEKNPNALKKADYNYRNHAGEVRAELTAQRLYKDLKYRRNNYPPDVMKEMGFPVEKQLLGDYSEKIRY